MTSIYLFLDNNSMNKSSNKPQSFFHVRDELCCRTVEDPLVGLQTFTIPKLSHCGSMSIIAVIMFGWPLSLSCNFRLNENM